MQTIQINNQVYRQIDFLSVNLSDSFVSPNNKIGSGSGEARLYISSQNTIPMFTFSESENILNHGRSYPRCNSTCYLIKENLIDYLESTYEYYLHPIQNHNRDILSFYNSRENMVNSLCDIIPFYIYMQNGNLDQNRFYIGCAEDAWNIIRELAIPTDSDLNIYSILNISKLINETNCYDIIYVFELKFISPNSQYNILQQENNISSTISNDTTINSTDRISLIKARNGQGKFRSNVLRIMPTCPFTGISDTFLLRASHIIPWRQCQNNYQRLDGFNGLSLTPTYDVLFDKGLISFNNNGSLLISTRLNPEISNRLGLVAGQIYNIQNIDGNRDYYLEFHRNHIFKI